MNNDIDEEQFKETFEVSRQSLINKLGYEGAEEEIESIFELSNMFDEASDVIAYTAAKHFIDNPTLQNFIISMKAAFLCGIDAYHLNLILGGIDGKDLQDAAKLGYTKMVNNE